MLICRGLLRLSVSVLCVAAPAPAPTSDHLFSSYSPVRVSVTAPFDELFERAQSNPDFVVKGGVAYTDAATGRDISIDDVEISVRGRTSRRETECSFPKLKLRFKSTDAIDSSIFSGMKGVKIGTHCGDQPDGELTERFGRWANEKAPLREAFVYRLLEVLRVRSFKARPARITYVFDDRRIARNAMFLEDDREAMKRLGASRELVPEHFRSADRDFTVDDTAKLAFAEALIGNFDWCLKFAANDTFRCDARHPLWNIVAFEPDEGLAFPLLYDFDIAGMVVGRHRWFSNVFYEGFLESKSETAIEVFGQVQHTRSLFSRAVLDATRRGFVERKDDAFRALEGADLDSDGRAAIKAYMDGFFNAIERDDQFYVPVVVREDERIYLDSGKTRPACPQDSVAPPGTLVGRQLETAGTMVKVPILDVQWRWAPPKRCDAVHRGPVWIDRGAISSDYPPR